VPLQGSLEGKGGTYLSAFTFPAGLPAPRRTCSESEKHLGATRSTRPAQAYQGSITSAVALALHTAFGTPLPKKPWTVLMLHNPPTSPPSSPPPKRVNNPTNPPPNPPPTLHARQSSPPSTPSHKTFTPTHRTVSNTVNSRTSA
jgi:hypothetical protein